MNLPVHLAKFPKALRLKPAVLPSTARAVHVDGRIVRPIDVFDVILFGVPTKKGGSL